MYKTKTKKAVALSLAKERFTLKTKKSFQEGESEAFTVDLLRSPAEIFELFLNDFAVCLCLLKLKNICFRLKTINL